MCISKEGSSEFSSVVSRGRAIGIGHKDVPNKHQETLFYCEGDWNRLPRNVVRYSKAIWA